LLAVGSSLIVSDNALSEETGSETDFIVATNSGYKVEPKLEGSTLLHAGRLLKIALA